MIIDEITLIVSVSVILLTLILQLFNPFRRKARQLKHLNETTSDGVVPPLSLVVIAQGKPNALEENLPLFLQQQYNSDWQIIVVADKDDGATEDVLKRFNGAHNLYTTFLPSQSRYVSRKKMAVTLGVKAAKNNWVVLVDVDCRPLSENWLSTLAQSMNGQTDIVMPYGQYPQTTKDFYRFERIHSWLYLERAARKRAYRTNTPCLAFKKDLFLSGGGYMGNLDQVFGEYEFIVNKFAKKGNTAVDLPTTSWIESPFFSKAYWDDQQVHTMEMKSMFRKSFSVNTLFKLDQFAKFFNIILLLAAIIYGIISTRYIISIVSLLLIFYIIFIRIRFARQALAAFCKTDDDDDDAVKGDSIASWKIIPFEWRLFYEKIRHKIQYLKADEIEFTTHKL